LIWKPAPLARAMESPSSGVRSILSRLLTGET
jgi:hypothetical protein